MLHSGCVFPTSEPLLSQSLLSLALPLHRFTQSYASPVIRHSHTESTHTPKASTHYTASVHTGSNPAVQSWRTTWSRFQKAMKSYPARSRISRGCSSQVRLEIMLARHYLCITGDHYPSLPSLCSVILRKKMTWDDLLSYLNTWSALHTFRQRNPADAENSRGDIAVRFWNDLKEGVGREVGRRVEGHDEVDVEWPLAMIMVKRA